MRDEYSESPFADEIDYGLGEDFDEDLDWEQDDAEDWFDENAPDHEADGMCQECAAEHVEHTTLQAFDEFETFDSFADLDAEEGSHWEDEDQAGYAFEEDDYDPQEDLSEHFIEGETAKRRCDPSPWVPMGFRVVRELAESEDTEPLFEAEHWRETEQEARPEV